MPCTKVLDLSASIPNLFAVQMRTIHCALFVAEVKVVGHIERRLACGKLLARKFGELLVVIIRVTGIGTQLDPEYSARIVGASGGRCPEKPVVYDCSSGIRTDSVAANPVRKIAEDMKGGFDPGPFALGGSL